MKLPFPESIISQHAIALGKTGSGKSTALRVIVEHLLDSQVPVCILDPKGDWWGLRASADGRRQGYEIVIFGGDHADVPINRESGAEVGALVAAGNRPAIIDLGGWTVSDRTKFFIAFAAAFFKHALGARYLVIDEVHNFAPQGKIQDPQAGMMLHWANRLASEGRGRGITLLSASQRPQKVHKDYVTSHETLIAKRVIHPLDRRAMQEWIDGCGDPALGKTVVDTLASMSRAEAWVWSPEAGYGPERITFPMFSTYDSFKPQAAHRGRLQGWASVDLAEVTEKLATAVEQAKANDPAELRKQIANLTRRLNAAPTTAVDQDQVYLDGYQTGKEHGYREGYQQGATKQLEAARLDYLRTLGSLPIDGVQHAVTELTKAILAAEQRAVPMTAVTPAAGAPPVKQIVPDLKPPAPIVKPPLRVPGGLEIDDISTTHRMGGGERRILEALGQAYPGGWTMGAWGSAAKRKIKGGSWKEYVGRLRRAGYVEERADTWFVTAAGMDALGVIPEPVPSAGPARVEFWASRVGGGAPEQMLRYIANTYPDWISIDDLGAGLSRAVSGGSFKEYMGRLRRSDLIEIDLKQKLVRATETLMG